MKLKRTLAMLMALTLAAGAAACGNSEGAGKADTQAPAADSSTGKN